MKATLFTFAAVVFALSGPFKTASARADVFQWVGYQLGPPGGLPNISGSASFFHADQWYGYVVPDADDVANFDTRFDPQENGMPSAVYFGDFTVPAVPIYNPSSFVIPGGDASVVVLNIKHGDFSFNFMSELGAPQGSLFTELSTNVANEPDTQAILTIRGGRLTTGGVGHIASSDRSHGTVVLNGPGAEWVLSQWLDLGWVGTGVVRVLNGARLDVAGGISCGIRDHSRGVLEIAGGGTVLGRASMAVGGGHESTGLARGTLTVTGAGSDLTVLDHLAIGGVSRGDAILRAGGRAACTDLYVRGPDSGSTLMIQNVDSRLTVSRTALVGWNGAGTALIRDRALLSCQSADVGVGASGRGSVRIDRNARLDVTDTLQVGVTGDGSVHLSSGALLSASQVFVGPNGLLGGAGEIEANIVSDGALMSTEGISVTGDVDLLDAGKLIIRVGSLHYGSVLERSASIARVSVTGQVMLGGTLRIAWAGSPPAIGWNLRLLSAGSITGEFSGLELPALPSDREWQVTTTSTEVTISVEGVSPRAQRVAVASWPDGAFNPIVDIQIDHSQADTAA